MVEDTVAEAQAAKHAQNAFVVAFVVLLVLSLAAFAANNRFAIGPGYWDYWPLFLLSALLVVPSLMLLYCLLRGGLRYRSGWLVLGITAAGIAVLFGWWIFIFIQPMLLHMATKVGGDYDLVSQGSYSRDRMGTWRHRRDGCPEVLATNEQLGEFSYCVPERDLHYANLGNVVTLRVDVSPFGTWIAGLPQLKVNAAIEAIEAEQVPTSKLD